MSNMFLTQFIPHQLQGCLTIQRKQTAKIIRKMPRHNICPLNNQQELRWTCPRTHGTFLNPPSSLSCNFLSSFSSFLSPHRPSEARTCLAERPRLCLWATSPSACCQPRHSERHHPEIDPHSPHAADILLNSELHLTLLLNSCQTASMED